MTLSCTWCGVSLPERGWTMCDPCYYGWLEVEDSEFESIESD